MTVFKYLPLLLLFLAAACQSTTVRATSTPLDPAETAALPSATGPVPEVTERVVEGRATPTTVLPSPAGSEEETQRDGGNADVTFVRALEAADGTWTFHVTVAHPDTGWEDYADGWDVVTPEGEVVKQRAEDKFTRLLLHPHVDEQPFTRSQRGLTLPPEVSSVTVRAHDLVDGFGGQEVIVDLSVGSGPGFEVERRGE